MRILIAAPAPREREGGVANVVYNTAASLRHRGHDVTCWFTEDVLPRPAPPRRFAALYFAYYLAYKISKQSNDFDAVTIHAPAGFGYGLIRRIRQKAKLPPYVMLLHGIEERRNHAMRREARKGRAIHFRWQNRIWQYLYHMSLYRLAIVTADQCVVINRETSIVLQLKYNRDAERVWYVPNGIEPRFFTERQCRESANPRLLFVGTWLDHKGIYYLRDSFELINKRFPGLRLTIAGCRTDADAVRSFFTPTTRTAVEIIPFVPSADTPALYREHDIFVLPSLMEGLPIVLLEAMASGKAIVTTETCGMMDLIENEYNGLLVKPADAESLAAAILRAVGSPELRIRLGNAAMETARRHSWGRVATDLERIFQLAVTQQEGREKRELRTPRPAG